MNSEFGGQRNCDTRNQIAAEARGEAAFPMPTKEDLPLPRTLSDGGSDAVGGEVDHSMNAHQRYNVDLASSIAEILEQWRRRQNWHRAEKSLTMQAKALCRRLVGGDKKEAELLCKAALGKGEHELADIAFAAIFPLIEARKGLERHRKAVEKRLMELARRLPAAEWVAGVRGVGLLSLAAIVGEAGDLSAYSNPAKLWKRMGLAVMTDGTRQRRIAGDQALAHGFNPARRAVVWSMGGAQIKTNGPYRSVYDARKAIETARVETPAHAHSRAKRFMEKRMLRDLWRAWHRCGDCKIEGIGI